MAAHLIEVTPNNSTGTISWTLCHKYKNTKKCGGPPNYVPVILGSDGAHVFIVSIDDPLNFGIRFPGKVEDALWIQAANKPTGPVIGPPDQIVDVVRANKTTLFFTDNNQGPDMTLKYQLNFVGSDNRPVTSIDPDIRNGGSDFIGENGAALLAGIALLVLLGAIWLGVKAIRRNAVPSGPAGDTRTSATEQHSDVNRNAGDRE